MIALNRAAFYEVKKILLSRAWWIVTGIVLIIQPVLAHIDSGTVVKLGLDATPERYPDLAQAFPPVEYMGIDMMRFGQMAMIVLGAVLGAGVYKSHELRTTFLCFGSRIVDYAAKLLAIMLCSAIVSFPAAYLTVAVEHIGLGGLGLDPLLLSPTTWRYIGYAAINWVLLTLLAYGMGLLCRNAIMPLVFLVPQVYNLGTYLAETWEWGKYLPVAAGNLLIATPADTLVHDPLGGGLTLALWALVALLLAAYSFIHRDVGGVY